ncbi:MAG: methionine adenosyltransferase, partial [Cyanobacteriota bacterium]
VRKNNTLYYLRPDGKTQVTVEYKEGKPVRIDTIIISTQHEPVIHGETENTRIQDIIAGDLRKYVVDPVMEQNPIKLDTETKVYINPSGRFVLGGPLADAGLTGRKIIVDTYGGYSRHGGGAFSGKDPTKVDRSAAYAARYVSKNIVAAGLAEKCELQIAYAIGMAKPVSINLETFGTNKIPNDKIEELVVKHFDLRPAAIIKQFDLRGLPSKNNGDFYRLLAAYGHMGRTDLEVPWERTDKAETLKKDAEKLGLAKV